MGCSSEKAIEIEEIKKDEKNLDNEELINIKVDNEPEVIELERKNFDMALKSKEDEPEVAENKNEIAVENEINENEEKEEIPDDIKEDEEVNYFEPEKNNNLKSVEKSNLVLKIDSTETKITSKNNAKKRLKSIKIKKMKGKLNRL